MEHSAQTIDKVTAEFMNYRFGETYDGAEMIDGDIAHFKMLVEVAVEKQVEIDKLTDRALIYIKSCILGFVLAAVFVGAIMWFDVAGIGGLIMGSDIGIMATLVFWVLNGIVFAGVQFSIVIMTMGENDDDDNDRRGRMMPIFQPDPIAITSPGA
ncbi:hypothetical protein GQR58_030471 [Nymphon striatum]|nr:hypothetical protein GQR58_030471 [Nymphon striatum]